MTTVQSYTALPILIFIFLITGCSDESYQAERDNHNLMIAKLDSIVEDARYDPLKYFHANEFRVAFLDSLINANPNDPRLRYYYAFENKNLGDLEKAISNLERLENFPTDSASQRMLNEELAINYLRLAEINNCFENYTPTNCILPFDEEAVHQNKSYVQSSISRLEFLLNRYPDNYTFHWMYNIAHIANSSYPDAMDSDYLIPGLQDQEDLPENLIAPMFGDVGMMKGVGVDEISGSACVEDFTGDGNPDIFVTSYGLTDKGMFFESDKEGGFNNRTSEAGLDGMMGGLNIVCSDINNSGHVDILILRGAWLAQHGEHPNSLLRNNGDGTFTDITISSGLYEEMPTQTAAFADINQDGYLDIFIGNESSSEWQDVFSENDEEPKSYPSAIFFNNGDETFKRVETLDGFELDQFVKGASWGDINNDGLPDLYVSVMGGDNKLFVHRGLDDAGVPQFEEISQKAGVE